MKVLYVSNVIPLNTNGGSAVAYRHLALLRNWGILAVAHADKKERTLVEWSDVRVPQLPLWLSRMRRGPFFPFAESIAAKWARSFFDRAADSFRPDGVVSVHLPDTLMAAAAQYARSRNLPLVLLCHDDYDDYVASGYKVTARKIYRQAARRLCVSPAMEESYRARYGVPGEVLYPIPSREPAAPREQKADEPLRLAYTGVIGFGYGPGLLLLAEALHRVGGQLLIASPVPRIAIDDLWAHPAVVDLGWMPGPDVPAVLDRAGVNGLCVVQSYDARDLRSFQYNFPSKLPEYATYGLPVVVAAPRGSSANRWARANPAAPLGGRFLRGFWPVLRTLRPAGNFRDGVAGRNQAAGAWLIFMKKYIKPLFGPAYHALKRAYWRRRRDAAFRQYVTSNKQPKLHIGCGKQVRPGWFNTDFQPFYEGAYYLDVTKSFPFPDNTFDRAFSEHMIEHVTYEQGRHFLRELYRVMKPDGRVRIATPNLRTLAALYAEPQTEEQRAYIETVIDTYNPTVGAHLPGFAINQLFGFNHLFLYDRDTLGLILKQAGFVKVEEYSSERTEDVAFRGMDAHANDYICYETLVLEAAKAGLNK